MSEYAPPAQDVTPPQNRGPSVEQARPRAGADTKVGAPKSAVAGALESQGRLQEAAWEYQKAGDAASAARVEQRLQSVLLGTPERIKAMGEEAGASDTWKLYFSGGIKGLFKKDGSGFGNTANERAAYRVSQLLGLNLVPMTLQRSLTLPDGKTITGSVQYWMNDIGDAQFDAEGDYVMSQEMRFFDFLIANNDRPGNILYKKGGGQVAIDNNLAFDDELYEHVKVTVPDAKILARLRAIPKSQWMRELAPLIGKDKVEAMMMRKSEVLTAAAKAPPKK